MVWTIEEIIYAVNGHVLMGVPHRVFEHISIDSRTVKPKGLFVAINGNTHRGINFLNDAVSKGIYGALLEISDINKLNLKNNINITFIVVKNTIRALGDLAAYHRKRTNLKVVAITGSMGKTTTRQIVSKISIQKYSTLSTKGNMNNNIGLPLTLLNIEKHHRVAILELGMNNLGEIDRLSKICQPDIGVITNVAPVHIENLGSINNIAIAKSEIIYHIKSKGSIILNIDDPIVRSMSKITELNVVFFGINANADIKGENISITNKGVSFLLKTLYGNININYPIPSKTMINNILAASAVGILLNCSNKEIKMGIELFKPDFGRLKIIKNNVYDIEIIDDTYNSNPVSLKNAIEMLNLIKKNRLSLAIVGDMMELGKEAKSMHYDIGKFIAKSGTDLLYATGSFAKYVIEGAVSMNMCDSKTYVGNRDDIIAKIKQEFKKNCVILIKGSRGMKMEQITFKIREIYNT